ncbi:MAG: FecR family protein [Nevskiaceae bacterium]
MTTKNLIVALLFAALPSLAPAQGDAPASPPAAPAAAPAEAIGEIALVTGSVTVATETQPRSLKAGDPLYAGQSITVAVNSYASLKFADGGRVLLRPNTEFAVEAYTYKPAPVIAPEAGAPMAPASVEGTAFFRLVRGGLRAISGLIGKGDHQQYKVSTPVATIGIRGTDYEVQLCTDDCPTPAQAAAAGTLVASTELAGLELAQADGGGDGGVVVATHEGSIEVRTPAGVVSMVVDAGQVGVMLASGQTFMLPVVPDMMIRDPAPDPGSCE